MAEQAVGRVEQHLLKVIEDTVMKLQELIGETEHYYGIVHESLPVIERNLELTQQETNILINYFIQSEQTAQAAKAGEFLLFAQALQKVRDNFREISTLLVGQEDVNRLLGLFLGGENRENSFRTFIDLVGVIKRTLSDVNDISLNAIIFSSRLGEEGRAFAVVSDHILQTSIFLEKEFQRIDAFLIALNRWYSEFQEDVQGIIGNQETAVKGYINRLEEIFANLIASIGEMSKILKNIIANVQLVLSPFQELMGLIQRQDIIRQNMENSIRCLQALELKYKTYLFLPVAPETKERRLDHIVFVNGVAGMTQKLVEGMSEQLVASLNQIGLTAKNLLQALDGVREEAQLLAAYLAGEPSIRHGSRTLTAVDYTFSSVYAFMEEFKEVLLEIRKRVNSLVEDRSLYDENILQVQQSLEAVQERVSLLKKIKLLSRIELARINRHDAAIGSKIDGVIEAVDETVTVNRNSFFKLKGRLQRDLDRFAQLVFRNQGHIDHALTEVNVNLERFGAANKIAGQAVLALSAEITALFQKLQEVNDALQHTVHLHQAVGRLKVLFGEIVQVTREQQEVELQRWGLQEWQEKNAELLELYKLFTSYLERLQAKEYLQAHELDEGSAEGDLTLF